MLPCPRPAGMWLTVTPSNNGIYIQIVMTDPNRRGDYIRNIRVVQGSHESSLTNGEIFNPELISRLKPFKTLRFMDWMRTNNSTQSTPDRRPTPKKGNYSPLCGVLTRV